LNRTNIDTVRSTHTHTHTLLPLSIEDSHVSRQDERMNRLTGICVPVFDSKKHLTNRKSNLLRADLRALESHLLT